MRKINKIILMTSAILTCAYSYADDFDSFGDFGDFGGDSSSGAASALEVNGSAEVDIRAYVDTSDKENKDGADKIDVKALPNAKLDLKYSGNKSDVELKLKVDEDTIKNHPIDVIDEAVLRAYLGNFTLEAGKMKLVWGKGDKLHVLDNFNADDYSDFIIPDYLDRRISTPMVRGVISLPFANMNLEGVYTPLLPVDRFAESGRWVPAQVKLLKGNVTGAAAGKVAAAFTRYTTATATAGSLKTLDAEKKAASAALELALVKALARQQVNAAGGSWDSMSDAAQNAFIQAHQSALSAGVAANRSALEAGLKANGYAFLFVNLQTASETYNAACVKAGFTADNIDAELKSAGTAWLLSLQNADRLSSNTNLLYPDLWTLKYGQFGGRATWTLGQVDMGLSYYNGWYKQPSVNASKLAGFLDSYLANGRVEEKDKFLAYDKKQTFGAEASTVLWHFNVRGEFAYNLTEDMDGTNPWIHNNSIAWLGGFDIDLPFWNANLNVQETGAYILYGDKCDENKDRPDVDYDKKGYSNNKVVANLTTSFFNDKVAPEVTVMYGIERGDLVVMPKLAVKPDQNLTLTASGMIINCADEDSEFYGWRKNSFASISAKYQF